MFETCKKCHKNFPLPLALPWWWLRMERKYGCVKKSIAEGHGWVYGGEDLQHSSEINERSFWCKKDVIEFSSHPLLFNHSFYKLLDFAFITRQWNSHLWRVEGNSVCALKKAFAIVPWKQQFYALLTLDTICTNFAVNAYGIHHVYLLLQQLWFLQIHGILWNIFKFLRKFF